MTASSLGPPTARTTATPAVLVVEDSTDIRRALEVLLTREGYRFSSATSGRAALRTFHEQRPDLVVLDVGLPDLDGWEVLGRIRDVSDVPVLMLTARSSEEEKVRGLRSGADDYVIKPFGSAELLARLEALLRRHRDPSITDEVFDDGVVRLDLRKHQVHVGGAEVDLTPVEFRLLSVLVRHAGLVLSRSQLLAAAWGDTTDVGPDRVKFAVLRLRRKLVIGDASARIDTVRGYGYRYPRKPSD